MSTYRKLNLLPIKSILFSRKAKETHADQSTLQAFFTRSEKKRLTKL